jgi:nucleoid-associated protein EbfC
MFGKLGDMAGMMKKAQEMQKNMTAVQEELAQTEVKGSSDCGKVEVTATCDMTIRRVTIKQECFETQNPEILETMVLSATNSAITAAKEYTQQKMSELTGGLNIPGLS